jgi:hypothetical protein
MTLKAIAVITVRALFIIHLQTLRNHISCQMRTFELGVIGKVFHITSIPNPRLIRTKPWCLRWRIFRRAMVDDLGNLEVVNSKWILHFDWQSHGSKFKVF